MRMGAEVNLRCWAGVISQDLLILLFETRPFTGTQSLLIRSGGRVLWLSGSQQPPPPDQAFYEGVGDKHSCLQGMPTAVFSGQAEGSHSEI